MRGFGDARAAGAATEFATRLRALRRGGEALYLDDLFHLGSNMIRMNRRKFLHAAAAGAALSAFPPAIQRALAIPANNATGTINDVEHVEHVGHAREHGCGQPEAERGRYAR